MPWGDYILNETPQYDQYRFLHQCGLEIILVFLQ